MIRDVWPELNDEQTKMVIRFRELHPGEQAGADGGNPTRHPLSWSADDRDGSPMLACGCGATLHLGDPAYVDVSSDGGDGVESLCQSAYVTLPDEALAQVRLHPSVTDMHFGLGLYLRNRFVYSGLVSGGTSPDSLSSGALRGLVELCIPEFADCVLIYGQLEHGALYGAYRYCMEVRGELPEEQFKRHYEILLGANELRRSNPYSFLDMEHAEEYVAWSARVRDMEDEYVLATLREVWDFGSIERDLGAEAAGRWEEACVAAASGERRAFLPSEIAYVTAGGTGGRGTEALLWAVREGDPAEHLPDEVFAGRDAVLRMVGVRGGLLERAPQLRDDDEVVLAAVASDPGAIEHASERLQGDRRVLVAAASNARDCLVFSDGPMAGHSDDDELVGLAIDANGANIAYASERIRGDYGMAMRAIGNRRDIYPDTAYGHLSDELKRDRRIALAVAEWDELPGGFPDAALADDDELGEALSRKGDHYSLIGMSRRIKEKYMTEDKLERWGDDPWWWDDEGEA